MLAVAMATELNNFRRSRLKHQPADSLSPPPLLSVMLVYMSIHSETLQLRLKK